MSVLPPDPKPATILIVDDEPMTRDILAHHAGQFGYCVRTATDGQEGLDAVLLEPPDLILCDVKMPRIDGMELVRRLKSHPDTRLIPIVMLTSLTDVETRVKALECGADDLLTKPPQRVELQARLRNLLRAKTFTDELERAETVLFTLAESVEAKDPYTGRHCQRLSAHSVMLGKALGMTPDELRALSCAGILHDLGKIGIPDHILLKPSPLTEDEWLVMRQHPIIGERICKPMKSMRLVLPIIRHHHERWDGKGYPDGLAGEAIPMTARILQVVDAWDALLTRRPYKPPLGKTEAFRILREETDQGKWDPRVMDQLLAMMSGTVPLEETYADPARLTS